MFKEKRIRTRRRYIAVKIDCEQKVDSGDLYDAVLGSILRLFGEYGASQTGIILIDFDPEKQLAIFRVSHRGLDFTKAAIVATTETKGKKIAGQILLISGTLKALKSKM